MVRCLKCGSSQLDSRGMCCAFCGGPPGVQWEQCYINDDTKSKLLDHAEELRAFGVTLEEPPPSLHKDAGTTMTAIGLIVSLSEALYPGGLRKLILFLRDIAIPKEEILRLRLDEPANVADVLRDPTPTPKSFELSDRHRLKQIGIDISCAKEVHAIIYQYPDGTKRIDITYVQNNSLKLISGNNFDDIRRALDELRHSDEP